MTGVCWKGKECQCSHMRSYGGEINVKEKGLRRGLLTNFPELVSLMPMKRFTSFLQ